MSSDTSRDAAATTEAPEQVPDDALTAEALVEEVSIDGMCGVY
jgi:mycofactocin precursor